MICLLDISGFIYRAFYAMPRMEHNGQEVGALFGFCSEMLNMLALFRGAKFVAALDCDRRTFRTELFADYKANREHMPEELAAQRNLIDDCCVRFGFQVARERGYEADDVIASVAAKYHGHEEIVVVSSDKDLRQLLALPNVRIYDPRKHVFVSEASVKEKFGVSSKQLGDFLALTGDSSDNIPGVPGIGPKSAAALLNSFDSLNNIIENIENLPQSKVVLKIKQNLEMAKLSRQLVELRTDLDMEVADRDVSYSDLIGFFASFGFDSLVKRLDKIMSIG